jgi:hypothetical protein
MLNLTTTIRIDEVSEGEGSQTGTLTFQIAVKGAIKADEMTGRFLAPKSMPLQVGMVAVATMNIKTMAYYTIPNQKGKICVEDPLIAEVYLEKLVQLIKGGQAVPAALNMGTIPF